MDASEPRVRHRGFFLHSDTVGEHDATEQENPEGFKVRVVHHRTTPSLASNARPATDARTSRGRAHTEATSPDESQPEIRSGSVTGSRQRGHLPR